MGVSTQRPPGLLWPDYVKTPHPDIDLIRRMCLARTLARTLDRTNVLGDDDEYGHAGCVNALSWEENGNLLLTGSDDRTVRLWRMDPTVSTVEGSESDFPFVCKSVIATGHRQNIFNVTMLPYSNRIVTAAGDNQVRVFDATLALAVKDGLETEFSARELSGRVIRCHTQRVKKLVTEDSPDVFLSLSEDGTVRQHDLRMRHNCREDGCASPLVEMRDSTGDTVELSNISLSRLTPYQFVVVGESPCGYLYDRRQLRRVMESEWGAVPRMGEGLTTCVRRFAKPTQPAEGSSRGRVEHISGCRTSDTNGHEVLMSYLRGGIYMFSTLDDPVDEDDMSTHSTSMVSPNSKSRSRTPSPGPKPDANQHNCDEPMMSEEHESEEGGLDSSGIDDEDLEDLEMLLGGGREGGGVVQEWLNVGVPVVHPRRSYTGHRSRDTIKDVNFLGPFDEYVVSGSDDGNWFVWEKDTGRLHGIYEGDAAVVNVIEGHPTLPLVAVSGIDNTVKLFSPAPGGGSVFSRMHKAKEITEANSKHKPVVRIPLRQLLMQAAQLHAGGEDGEGPPGCPTQ